MPKKHDEGDKLLNVFFKLMLPYRHRVTSPENLHYTTNQVIIASIFYNPILYHRYIDDTFFLFEDKSHTSYVLIYEDKQKFS